MFSLSYTPIHCKSERLMCVVVGPAADHRCVYRFMHPSLCSRSYELSKSLFTTEELAVLKGKLDLTLLDGPETDTSDDSTPFSLSYKRVVMAREEGRRPFRDNR